MHYYWLRQFRRRLADTDSLLHFSILGIFSGLTCGLIMLAFHYAIIWLPSLWMPGNNAENFEDLASWQHFLLPVIGALFIGLVFSRLPASMRRTGIPHVITRLHSHHGHMPAGNTVVQFLLGAVAIATGQAGGREGPSIHLGAGVNSLLGQKLLLPNNSVRVLVGCGTAAAIAAAFNTPIAGVIFAMEVVMMEYTIAGFIPVLLAAATATAFTQAVGINHIMFDYAVGGLSTLLELPYIVGIGLAVGCSAALFLVILKRCARKADTPIIYRMLIAGVITGSCAVFVPEIMGLGYDTLGDTIAGQLPLTLLIAIALAKLVATAVSCGLGVPLGLIGPNLLIGACLGSAIGLIGHTWLPEHISHPEFYTLLGMGAMMGAVMNAPLAALMALVELTQSTTIIFPAMLAITVATLTCTEVFKQQSATQTVLTQLREVLRTDPISLALQRTSVAGIMSRQLELVPQHITTEQATALLQRSPSLLVVSQAQEVSLIRWSDIQTGLETALIDCQNMTIDLMTLSHHSEPAANLHIQATLREAIDTMNAKQVDTVFVSGYISGPYPDHGILTRADIEHHTAQPL